jgi:hypothetical protein
MSTYLLGELAAFGVALGCSPLHIGLLISMDKGGVHLTGLDLLAAGDLLEGLRLA